MKEIKVGQKWKTRAGKVVEVVGFDSTDKNYPWQTNYDCWFDNQGLLLTGQVNDSDFVELVFDPEEGVVPATTKYHSCTLPILELRDKIKEADEWLSSIHSQIEQKKQERIDLVKQLNELGLDVFIVPTESALEADMTDSANWEVGDVVVSISDSVDDIRIGNHYTLTDVYDTGRISFRDDDNYPRTRYAEYYQFVSRPSKEA